MLFWPPDPTRNQNFRPFLLITDFARKPLVVKKEA